MRFLNYFLFLLLMAITSPALSDQVKLSAKTQSVQMDLGGLKREFLYYIPAGISISKSDPNGLIKLPLVLVLHGGSGKPEGMEKLTFNRFNELADRDGGIIVYPAGIDHNWNDGREVPSSKAFRDHIDDVGFLSALIDRFISDFNADPKRVYVTGISNGGIMSTRLACELSDKLAAAAPVAGSMPANLPAVCKPHNPVSMLFINGDADPLVPFNGGNVHFFRKQRGEVIPVSEAVSDWALMDGCKGQPTSVNLPVKEANDPTRVERVAYAPAANGSEVLFFIIHGGGHTWPNGLRYAGDWAVGKVSHQLDATDLIWDFFKRHSR